MAASVRVGAQGGWVMPRNRLRCRTRMYRFRGSPTFSMKCCFAWSLFAKTRRESGKRVSEGNVIGGQSPEAVDQAARAWPVRPFATR